MKFRYQKIPFHGHNPNRPLVSRPFVPVYLSHGENVTRAPYYALLDTGADNVLLPADLAKEVGISDIASGKSESILGVVGQKAEIYYHDAQLQLVGDSRILKIEVGFSESIYIPLLGRTFFEHFKSVCFREEKGEIEFKNAGR